MSLWERWSLVERLLAVMLSVAIALAIPHVRLSISFRFTGQFELGEN